MMTGLANDRLMFRPPVERGELIESSFLSFLVEDFLENGMLRHPLRDGAIQNRERTLD